VHIRGTGNHPKMTTFDSVSDTCFKRGFIRKVSPDLMILGVIGNHRKVMKSGEKTPSNSHFCRRYCFGVMVWTPFWTGYFRVWNTSYRLCVLFAWNHEIRGQKVVKKWSFLGVGGQKWGNLVI